jgi:hypothetical protein
MENGGEKDVKEKCPFMNKNNYFLLTPPLLIFPHGETKQKIV